MTPPSSRGQCGTRTSVAINYLVITNEPPVSSSIGLSSVVSVSSHLFTSTLVVVVVVGARCLPASRRERQQDVLRHHGPVEDQQHVPLQPRLVPPPLPEGAAGQEGDWSTPRHTSISLQQGAGPRVHLAEE